MPAEFALGDTVALDHFPGADRPAEFRHSRHDYDGEDPGYPDYTFEATEPLAWQDTASGVWQTRLRLRGRDGFLTATALRACDSKCERKKPPAGKRKRKRLESCSCPYQLHVTLNSRSGRQTKVPYSRIVGWVPPPALSRSAGRRAEF